MGLFNSESIKVLNFREDYIIDKGVMPVEEYASDVITKKKNGIRDRSYELAHPLMKKCYGIPGIPDGKKVLMICSRDVVFNPLNQYPDLYSKEAVQKRMGEMAREQQHKAEKSHNSGPMNVATILLGGSAFVMVLALCIMVGLNFYKGM